MEINFCEYFEVSVLADKVEGERQRLESWLKTEEFRVTENSDDRLLHMRRIMQFKCRRLAAVRENLRELAECLLEEG